MDSDKHLQPRLLLVVVDPDNAQRGVTNAPQTLPRLQNGNLQNGSCDHRLLHTIILHHSPSHALHEPPRCQPTIPSAQAPDEPFADHPSDQAPPSAHLTPSRAFPSSENGTLERTRASLATSDGTNPKEQPPHSPARGEAIGVLRIMPRPGGGAVAGACGEGGRMQR